MLYQFTLFIFISKILGGSWETLENNIFHLFIYVSIFFCTWRTNSCIVFDRSNFMGTKTFLFPPCVLGSQSNANCFTVIVEVGSSNCRPMIKKYCPFNKQLKLNVYAINPNHVTWTRMSHRSAGSEPPTFNNTNNINWFATSIRNDTGMECPESMLF